ncbi:MAG: pentapeptide repeat-containing protein [Lachnospiraceae bacterium]
MDKIEWQKKHHRECYHPAAKAYLEQTLKEVTLQAKEIHKELTGQVDAFLQSLCLWQEMGKLGAVETISISFPYTSLVCGCPYFLFAVYPGEPFLEEALVMREFPVSWMFPGWEDFLEQIKRRTGEQGMNRVIRMPYIRSKAMGTARIEVWLMATLIKYHLYGLREREVYQRLKKTDHFVLWFGEYGDWQKPLLAEREEIDIFLCEKDTDLRFCRFHQAWYENKEFSRLTLDDCQFRECRFLDSRLEESSFKDARFLGCTFQNCEFSKLDVQGARFEGCVFSQVSFSKMRSNAMLPEIEEITGLQGMTEFISCSFSTVNIKSSDFSASIFKDCRMEAVEVEDSSLPDEFYQSLKKGEEKKT